MNRILAIQQTKGCDSMVTQKTGLLKLLVILNFLVVSTVFSKKSFSQTQSNLKPQVLLSNDLKQNSVSHLPNELTLSHALSLAKNYSPQIKAAKAQASAAAFQAEASQSQLFPTLNLEGSYRKQSVVPEASIGLSKLKLADDHSYSIGPTLSYTIWDSGVSRYTRKSLQFLEKAKNQQYILSSAQIELATQTAYVQASLHKELVELTQKANNLAKVQNKDIQAKVRGGSASQLDALNSDSEVLNYELKLEQTQSDLVSSLANLSSLIGKSFSSEVHMQSLKELLATISETDFSQTSKSLTSSSHPLIRVQKELEQSALAQVEIKKAAHWPTLSLQWRGSLDYPNGPTFEQINQSATMAYLSWNLFDFGRRRHQIDATKAEADATAWSLQSTRDALKKEIETTKSKLESLKKQVQHAEVFVEKAEKLAKLNYSTYKYGRLSFSEVQTANLRQLEAQNRLALYRTQYLIQIFNWRYLNTKN